MDSSYPKMDVDRPKSPHLIQIQSDFMKKAQAWNQERIQQLRAIRSRNLFTGLLLGSVVLGIYTYSITAIRQETFLNDLEEPERIEE